MGGAVVGISLITTIIFTIMTAKWFAYSVQSTVFNSL